MGIKLPDWLTNTNNILGITGALGVSVSGLFSWLVGRLAHLRLLDVVFLFCAVSLTLFWTLVALLWLKDRNERIKTAEKPKNPQLNCEYGLMVECVLLNRDTTNPNHEWQFTVVIRNSKDWPLRIMAIETRLNIEKKLPSTKMVEGATQIIPAKGVIGCSSSLYKSEDVPDLDRLNGEIGFRFHYGHPAHGFSRTFEFDYRFSALIRLPAQGQGVFVPPISPPYVPNIAPLMEDRDYPYEQPPTNLPALHPQVEVQLPHRSGT